MSTTNVLLYFAAAFGLAYIVGHSVISRAAREWLWAVGEPLPALRWIVMLLECPACFGFWIGFVTALSLEAGTLGRALILGFATAGTNLILASFAGLMPSSSPKE